MEPLHKICYQCCHHEGTVTPDGLAQLSPRVQFLLALLTFCFPEVRWNVSIITVNWPEAVRWASNRSNISWATSSTSLRSSNAFLLATNTPFRGAKIKQNTISTTWKISNQQRKPDAEIEEYRRKTKTIEDGAVLPLLLTQSNRKWERWKRRKQQTWLLRTAPPSISLRLFSRRVVPLLTKSNMQSAVPICKDSKSVPIRPHICNNLVYVHNYCKNALLVNS